ncbi:sigma-70 family RNA polymerase sigma factor, partial [bacterium]|nr:sigma-70 family RNA polymerase sigma factor [bacterium]
AKVALHVAQDHLRNKYRKKEEGLEIHYSPFDNGETHLKEEPNVHQEDDRILDRVDLLQALQSLPERSREIIIMKGQGYNYEEIAAEMDLTVSGVKMQVKRSMETLRLSLFDVTFFALVATSLLGCA